ncbi:MAG: hypothetical protein MHM6MM_005823 [Cercozoa sp. M6MM]
MTKKRRNGGKNRKGRGHVKFVRCDKTARAVPKDKAVKRTSARTMFDGPTRSDIKDNCAYGADNCVFPKVYVKHHYSISAAIHSRIVRGRAAADRRVRSVKTVDTRR